MQKMKSPKDVPWTLAIKTAMNGATLVNYEDALASSTLYDFDQDNQEQLVSLLYDIYATLCMTSKWDRQRIEINIKHGSDYTCKGCKICREKD